MKKILISVMVIAVAVAIVAGGSMAYFSDKETSNPNTFTAGKIDISLDPSVGQDVATVEGDLYLMPCETGYTYTCIHNDGDKPSEVWKHIANVVNSENGITEPEQEYYTANPGSESWLISNWIHYDLLAYKSLGYSAEAKAETYAYYKDLGIDVDITVEDGDCAVTWTFDFPIDDDEGNGNMGYALVIDLDCDDEPDFQVHNNDGTCAAFPWGTHLYSPWDPTKAGYNGWHTSEADWNTPVADIDWISASGDRYHDSNPTGVFTVTIDKCRLVPEFCWAAHFGAGGFWDYGGLSQYPKAWAPWSGDASTFVTATIAEQVQEVTEAEGFTLTGTNGVESHYVYLGILEPWQTLCVIQSYHLDGDVDNWGQSDKVSFDMEFVAQQLSNPNPPGPELSGHGR